MMGFLEISRKNFPLISKEYIVTENIDWGGSSEPARLNDKTLNPRQQH